ncbi:MAG: saccharopine dehydrogenase NADP-binding domain-containing protein, partial [Telluria sp.]
VVNELRRRGMPVLAVARDITRIACDVPAIAATITDPGSLDRAFAGCAVVINCAGPFLDTAAPIVEAALRANASYLDVTAEQPSASWLFTNYDRRARDAGVAIIPAAGFYGGLADLLASVLVPDGRADEITVAVALDHWWPTEGTRITGARNKSERMMVKNGELTPITLPAEETDWDFGPPFNTQRMVELSFSEVVTIAHHIRVDRLRSFFSMAPLGELRSAATPGPTAVDADGRSSQRFALEVIARTGDLTRRALATGQDIYAISAPLVVEAAARMMAPPFISRGTLSLGQAFEPRDYLDSVTSRHFAISTVGI